MPYFYEGSLAATQTTNATPGTENDAYFAKPSSTRTLWCVGIVLSGKAAGLNLMSTILARLKAWTTTSSSGGTAVTPSADGGIQAATHTEGAAAATVTSGTGGPTWKTEVSCSQSAMTPLTFGDPSKLSDQAYSLPAGANNSLDLFVSSPTASMNYGATLLTAE